MPYYTHNITGSFTKFLRDPGAGYTLIPAMPAGDDRAIAEWWRERDLTTAGAPLVSSWHPSIPELEEPES
jgi:hypothetical protein